MNNAGLPRATGERQLPMPAKGDYRSKAAASRAHDVPSKSDSGLTFDMSGRRKPAKLALGLTQVNFSHGLTPLVLCLTNEGARSFDLSPSGM
jgi:hypothetical protein